MADDAAEQAFLQAQALNDSAGYGMNVNEVGVENSDSDDYDPSAQDYSIDPHDSKEDAPFTAVVTENPEHSNAPVSVLSPTSRMSVQTPLEQTPLEQTPRPTSKEPVVSTKEPSKPLMRGGFVVDEDEKDDEDRDEQSVDVDPYEPAEITESTNPAASIAESTVDSSSHEQRSVAQASHISQTASNNVASPVSSVQNAAMRNSAGVATPVQSPSNAQVTASVSNGVAQSPTAAGPKSRLPHDRVGILEDRIKEDPKGDIDAWQSLIKEHRDRNRYSETCKTYERFFRIFPSAAEMWMAYAQWEDDNNRLKAMEVIFGKTLLQINYVGLWSMYLKYVRRRNPLHTDVDGRAYKIISDAFDLALKNIGIDKDSGEIWKEYINFLKSGPGVVGGNSWQDTQKMDALRVAYKRAVCIPTSALESLWKEYGGFETGLNKINGRKFLQERTNHYMDARSAYVQLQNITRDLDRTTLPKLPPAPGFEGYDEYMNQVEIWNAWIQFEKKDELVLKEQDPNSYRDRIIYVYKQALMALRFWPEMWFSAAEFCFENGLDDQGYTFLSQGAEANPESCLLAFRLADWIEFTTSNDEGQDPGAKIRMSKVREPYNKVLDTLYDLVSKAKSREIKDVAQAEATVSETNGIGASDDRPYADDDEDLKGDSTDIKANIKSRVEAIKQATNATIAELSKTISCVWIGLMRAARRIQGKGATQAIGFRAIFSDARKRGKLTSDLYVETALIEYHCYQDPAGTKIFERGMKLYPEDENFALEYLKHLIAINDITNARAVFETTAGKLTSQKEKTHRAKALFSFFHEYESHFGDLTQIVKLEKRMKDLYPEDPTLKHFATRFSSSKFDPTSVQPIISPQQIQPRQSVLPSIEESHLAVDSPRPRFRDSSVTNSPKRPLPDEFGDDAQNAPRKLARGESPLKGAAGRRLDQKRNMNINGQYQQTLPPPPLPSQISFLLSIIPKASAYTDARFDAEKMVKLMRDIRIPASFHAWQQEQQARQQYVPPAQSMVPGIPMGNQYGTQYRY